MVFIVHVNGIIDNVDDFFLFKEKFLLEHGNTPITSSRSMYKLKATVARDFWPLVFFS
jgi:hypothetical protein